MKKKKKYISLYRKNSDNGRIIIDIALENYLEFFHEWDNSAFKKRDIHAELVNFLDLCSEDIPLKKDLEIVFTLPTNKINKEKEDLIRSSFKNYYSSVLRLEQRKTKKIIKSSVVLLVIAITLLTLYGLLNSIRQESIISKVFLESLLIGGWVFAWEAVHLLFIDILEPFHKYRETKRLLNSNLSFRYSLK